MPLTHPTRRTVSTGVAWSIPAVVIGAPAPAVAMSGDAQAFAGPRPHADAPTPSIEGGR